MEVAGRRVVRYFIGMNKVVVVGGGISGLLAAKQCRDRGMQVVGLETSLGTGGLAAFGAHRLLSRESIEILSSVLGPTEWSERTQTIGEFHKGELRSLPAGLQLSGDEEDESLQEELYGYFHPTYFWSNTGIRKYIETLQQGLGHVFHLRRSVVKVDLERREYTTLEGEAENYDALIWCAPLHQLAKVYRGPHLEGLTIPKKMKENPMVGGFVLEQFLNRPLDLPYTTLKLRFRFKEHRLHTVGLVDFEPQTLIQWIVPLPSEVMENREELAKAVRSFKREIDKQAPMVSGALNRERIIYCPLLGNEVLSLEAPGKLGEGLWYFGPAIRSQTKAKLQRFSHIDSIAHALPPFAASLANDFPSIVHPPSIFEGASQSGADVNENHSQP